MYEFRQLGDGLLWAGFENQRRSPNCRATFFTLMYLGINFNTK
jgi:hypothetical protein